MKFFKLLFVVALLFSFSIANEKVKIVDVNLLSKQATKESKHTLLFFHMTYCPYCKRMKKFVFNDKKVQEQIERNFLFVDVNVDDDDLIMYKKFKDTKKQFANKLKISFYPTIVFIDENNEIIYTLKGYRSKDTFKNVLNYIRGKVYLDKDFSAYLDDLEFEK